MRLRYSKPLLRLDYHNFLSCWPHPLRYSPNRRTAACPLLRVDVCLNLGLVLPNISLRFAIDPPAAPELIGGAQPGLRGMLGTLGRTIPRGGSQ